jgi:glycerol-3-phosphate O-acyltransferase / dihydroxyacetone phosphate acyltransferase
MYFIYYWLRFTVKVAFWAYFSRRTFINRQGLRFKGPAILVSNHPNTLLDPLNAAEQVPRVVHFLANASLFRGRFQNWFFNTFFCIPIERHQDTQGAPLNNRAAFARCDEFLGKGGCLYIAPEGTSEMERRLRPVRTGTARIGLSAEVRQDFQLGLVIIPVGLTYDAPNRFRSGVTINVGAPIRFKDYEAAYRADSFKTAKQITRELENRLRELVIDTRNPTDDQLVAHLEAMLRHSRPVSAEAHFFRTKALIENLRHWQAEQPVAYAAFAEEVDTYFAQLATAKTDDAALAAPPRPLALQLLALVIFFPLFLYGWINNFLPAALPAALTRRLQLYVGYDSTVKILVGLLTFPLFYFLQTRLVYVLYDGFTAWMYLLSLVPAGLLAWRFRTHQRRVLAYLRLRQHNGQAADWRKMRQHIWEKTDILTPKK